VALFTALSIPALAQWPGWGGPKRDFKAQCDGLPKKWPDEGPKKVWSRELGPGYSAIAVDGDKLYTMYRKGDEEVVTALEAASGKTVWEHAYPAPVPEGMDPQFGKGPNATPQIHNGHVYTLGVGGQLLCVDQKTGKPAWSHDLIAKFGAKVPSFGFSSSPVVYKDMLIVAGGGAGSAVMAFDLDKGELRWKAHDFENVYSSPLSINIDGQDQIVLLADKQVVGLNPASGEQLWSHEHVNQWSTNISTPVWSEDHMLFVTTGGEGGSKGLKLTVKDGKTQVEETWKTRKMAVGQGNVIRVRDNYYGVSGDAPAFFACADAKTGDVKFRERGFSKAMMVYGDDRFIVLDEDGNLALVSTTPDGIKVDSKVQLLKKPAWTVPTLIGKTLYVRDTEKIMALDVSVGQPET
jgi:outer membrane protein assembly factor BamB